MVLFFWLDCLQVVFSSPPRALTSITLLHWYSDNMMLIRLWQNCSFQKKPEIGRWFTGCYIDGNIRCFTIVWLICLLLLNWSQPRAVFFTDDDACFFESAETKERAGQTEETNEVQKIISAFKKLCPRQAGLWWCSPWKCGREWSTLGPPWPRPPRLG